ncbi:MAG: hypothetical protein EXR59_05080 [Dehalococcoidia bacterium]|nr:hypothetical protein [Dehalococcoidia bacterium]
MATSVELPEAILDQIFVRSGGKCECTHAHAKHAFAPHRGGKCPRGFFRYGPYFNARSKSSEKGDNPDNYEGVCKECLALAE